MEITNSIQNLYQSLVGVSLEFRDGKSQDHVDSGEALNLLRSQITNFCQKVLDEVAPDSEITAIATLACLVDYYRRNPNYYSVRSAIVLRRLRPKTLEFLKFSVDFRAKKILDLVETEYAPPKTPEIHYALRECLRYFIGVYPSRFKYYKIYLNKEDRLYVLQG